MQSNPRLRFPRLPVAMLAASLAAAALPASAGEPSVPPPGAPEPAVPPSLARQPLPRVYSAGQPGPGEWTAIAAQGVTTIVDLRPDAERPGRDEAAEVRAAGLDYRQIPVAGPRDLTPEAAHALWQAIETAPGQVLVHCASGNRAGALLAIAAVREGGMAPEQALAAGRKGGMANTEARVREVLGLPAADRP
ncbi:MAG TPA: protein tyrosine phosphatase family protein [Luteimonas sp.]|nr:protein tyrosine phosphatase family protein [Luteimonas sp.]